MKALLRRVYHVIQKFPVIGSLLQKTVQTTKAWRHSASLRSERKDGFRILAEKEAELNSLAERIAVLEQIKPAMNNYMASWADTVSLIRKEQEALKSEVGRLSAIVEKLDCDSLKK